MNDDQLLRYSRQIMLPQIDGAGQERLKNSKVLIVGLGGLGSPTSIYLAAAGIGELTLIDFDKVSLSNLQRQILYVAKTECICCKDKIYMLQRQNLYVAKTNLYVVKTKCICYKDRCICYTDKIYNML